MARPFPIPSPAHPAPVTRATLPLREREGGSYEILAIFVVLFTCTPWEERGRIRSHCLGGTILICDLLRRQRRCNSRIIAALR